MTATAVTEARVGAPDPDPDRIHYIPVRERILDDVIRAVADIAARGNSSPSPAPAGTTAAGGNGGSTLNTDGQPDLSWTRDELASLSEQMINHGVSTLFDTLAVAAMRGEPRVRISVVRNQADRNPAGFRSDMGGFGRRINSRFHGKGWPIGWDRSTGELCYWMPREIAAEWVEIRGIEVPREEIVQDGV